MGEVRDRSETKTGRLQPRSDAKDRGGDLRSDRAGDETRVTTSDRKDDSGRKIGTTDTSIGARRARATSPSIITRISRATRRGRTSTPSGERERPEGRAQPCPQPEHEG